MPVDPGDPTWRPHDRTPSETQGGLGKGGIRTGWRPSRWQALHFRDRKTCDSSRAGVHSRESSAPHNNGGGFTSLFRVRQATPTAKTNPLG